MRFLFAPTMNHDGVEGPELGGGNTENFYFVRIMLNRHI